MDDSFSYQVKWKIIECLVKTILFVSFFLHFYFNRNITIRLDLLDLGGGMC